VHPHDRTDVSREVPPTRGDGQILARVEPVRVDHKVAVVLVDGRDLAPVLRVEELGQGPALDGVDRREVEPGAVRGDDDRVRLGREVAPRRRQLAAHARLVVHGHARRRRLLRGRAVFVVFHGGLVLELRALVLLPGPLAHECVLLTLLHPVGPYRAGCCSVEESPLPLGGITVVRRFEVVERALAIAEWVGCAVH
jgi:hypothetical protein